MSSRRCAACKQLRRRCPSDCIFLPYFPPNNPQRFSFVHKIYGASNVGKMLQQVQEHQRADVANSLYYEAYCRIKSPVHGCLGIISILRQEIDHFKCELAKIQAELSLVKAQAQIEAQGQVESDVYHPSFDISRVNIDLNGEKFVLFSCVSFKSNSTPSPKRTDTVLVYSDIHSVKAGPEIDPQLLQSRLEGRDHIQSTSQHEGDRDMTTAIAAVMNTVKKWGSRSYEKKREERRTTKSGVEAMVQHIVELTKMMNEEATLILKSFGEENKNIEDVVMEVNPSNTTTMPTFLNELDIKESLIISQQAKPIMKEDAKDEKMAKSILDAAILAGLALDMLEQSRRKPAAYGVQMAYCNTVWTCAGLASEDQAQFSYILDVGRLNTSGNKLFRTRPECVQSEIPDNLGQDTYKLFKKEFNCTSTHWRARRPIAFVIALLGDFGISIRIWRDQYLHMFCDSITFKGVDGAEITLVPMILAEIFRALKKCKSGETWFFEGCNLLLQMWAKEHFYKHNNMNEIMFSTSHTIDTHDDRMRSFISPLGTDDWFEFLAFHTSDQVQWIYPLLSCSMSYIQYKRLYYIDLIGLTGLQPYAPVWVREYRGYINPSPEGEQDFEDVGMTIWIRHFCLGTTTITLEVWAQMSNMMQYSKNAGARPSNIGPSTSMIRNRV
ncbi:LOB domain-containing protein 23 [Capsicum annuum]|nr:LOB domain-containing protein 23 [Capsicum annuum]